ncbi:hypothetical protein GUITHDRAFT_141398 [Guillardia theta CCMP2712]|uniref:Uncharacterized protein n=1 Tax=Guillardia theta (strain CCMP2712) TaxID=905079 RepID=L1J275_GUITC|nr:hypothetical protein GUITHDRAFT_141398 [Guillardia theta CCMP2712]EKX42195.1 hypothetical protein GUITHDRAFT_141398 [Guillardia theta CCMP2712]|eukprot:XP_005829175.1 hypothetical protein GUITHDRAFT_141398 [Guillardia theta CCMP2712]
MFRFFRRKKQTLKKLCIFAEERELKEGGLVQEVQTILQGKEVLPVLASDLEELKETSEDASVMLYIIDVSSVRIPKWEAFRFVRSEVNNLKKQVIFLVWTSDFLEICPDDIRDILNGDVNWSATTREQLADVLTDKIDEAPSQTPTASKAEEAPKPAVKRMSSHKLDSVASTPAPSLKEEEQELQRLSVSSRRMLPKPSRAAAEWRKLRERRRGPDRAPSPQVLPYYQTEQAPSAGGEGEEGEEDKFKRVSSKGSRKPATDAVELDKEIFQSPAAPQELPDDEAAADIEEELDLEEAAAGEGAQADSSKSRGDAKSTSNAREGNRVRLNLDPRSSEMWSALTKENQELDNTVGLLRSSAISAKSKMIDDRNKEISGAGGVETYGTVDLLVVEARGINKDFEDKTPNQYTRDVVARTLKPRSSFKFNVRGVESIIELEVMVMDLEGFYKPVGMVQLPVRKLEKQPSLQGWHQLTRRGGGASSIAVNLKVDFDKLDFDPLLLAAKARKERKKLQEESMAELPPWISKWDIHRVKEFNANLQQVFKRMRDALEEDTLEALEQAHEEIFRFRLQEYELAHEIVQRLAEVREKMQAQEKVRSKMMVLVTKEHDNIMFTLTAVQDLLMQAKRVDLTTEDPLVARCMELLQVIEEQIAQKTA